MSFVAPNDQEALQQRGTSPARRGAVFESPRESNHVLEALNRSREDMARASEICREHYAALGAYGQPWCEQWNGEMWGHWCDQDGRSLRALGGAFMEKTNLETMTDQQAKTRADVTAIEEQSETWRDSAFRSRTLLNFAVLCLCAAPAAYGQTDPWSTAAGQLANAFTGPIAKGFALVAIVLGGLQLAFSEGGHSRVMGGLIFGVGLALGAATFLSWITT